MTGRRRGTALHLHGVDPGAPASAGPSPQHRARPAALRDRRSAGVAIALVQLGALGRVGTSVLLLSALLAVLVIGMHIALRVVAPDADPFVLPIATLLNGIGIAEITRLDIAEGLNGWDAAGIRQIAWTAIAIVIAIVVILAIRNHRVLQRFRYVAMFTAFLLLRAAGHPRPPQPALRRVHLDPDRPALVPAGRARQDRAGDLLRRLPRAGARLAVDGRAPVPRHDRSRGRATSARSSSSGCWRWRSSCCSATSAPRCSTSACSS